MAKYFQTNFAKSNTSLLIRLYSVVIENVGIINNPFLSSAINDEFARGIVRCVRVGKEWNGKTSSREDIT